MIKKSATCIFFILIHFSIQSQETIKKDSIEKKGIAINLNKEGTANIHFITLLQSWARYTEYNPGTVYKEKERTENFDFPVRRAVFTVVTQLNPRTLLLLNVSGTNNSGEVAFQSSTNLGILDAYGEYKFNNALYIGAGLHQWTGFSRLNEDGVGSLLNLDQPSFQQITWNKLDKLGRFLGIYAKGDIGKFNYRVSVNDAYVTPTTNFAANTGKGSPNGGYINGEARNAQVNVGYFNPAANSKILQGYLEYAFWDKEKHIIPYQVSTYNGAIRLLNFGAGFLYRKDGILTPTRIELRNAGLPESTTNPKIITAANESDIKAFAIDGILLYPFSSNLDGIALYTGYFRTDLGSNYYTVTNVFNNVIANNEASAINSAGNAYPATGTSTTIYTQLGYIAPKTLLKNSRLGVFGTYQNSNFEALKDNLVIYEAGINWFLSTNKFKITLAYRNRPVYTGNAAYEDIASQAVVASRRGEIITQFQFNF